MAADDFMESEVAIAAAATAALFSPRVREVARKGVVYGIAGVLTAGRAVAGVAREAGRGVGSARPWSRSAPPNATAEFGAVTSDPVIATPPVPDSPFTAPAAEPAAGRARRPRPSTARTKPTAASPRRSGGTPSTGNAEGSGTGSPAPSPGL